ncbi:polysaccharide pyruvyl transferase family protein [Gordonia sp. NPDC003429]
MTLRATAPVSASAAARPRRVVLFNAWHDDNKGDAAITEGILGLLRARVPEIDITVVGLTEDADPSSHAMRHLARGHPEVRLLPNPMPSELRGRPNGHPAADVPIWVLRLIPAISSVAGGYRDRRYDAVLEGADLVIGVGGSNIYTDVSVQGLVSLTRLFTVVAPLRAAITRGIPTILLGHTLGPFPASRPVTKRIAQRMLCGVGTAVVRDESSLGVAAELGVGGVQLAPDMAYGIEPRMTDAVAEVVAAMPVPMSRTVVIAMRSHPSLGGAADQRVVGELVTAVDMLVARGDVDHTLVIAHTLGPTAIEDDRAVSVALHHALCEDGHSATYVDADLSPAELAALYGSAAAMIAVRLHAAILAMLSGTPTFAIAYFSSKSAGVMRQAGQEECIAEFSDVTASRIVAALAPRIGDDEFRTALADTSRRHRQALVAAAESWFSTSEPGTSRVSEGRA